MFTDSQVCQEPKVILDRQGQLDRQDQQDQQGYQEHVVTLEDEEDKEDEEDEEDGEDQENEVPKDQAGFLGDMYIKDYKVRQVPKGSKGCRESKESKECRGYKGYEPGTTSSDETRRTLLFYGRKSGVGVRDASKYSLISGIRNHKGRCDTINSVLVLIRSSYVFQELSCR